MLATNSQQGGTMLEQACVAIDDATDQDRKQRSLKYARRNKMRYIDRLLNELEMLNLADRTEVPRPISDAVVTLLDESELDAALRPDSVTTAMDLLYEIQDSLMFNQIEDE
jgi:hypothetical protein